MAQSADYDKDSTPQLTPSALFPNMVLSAEVGFYADSFIVRLLLNSTSALVDTST